MSPTIVVAKIAGTRPDTIEPSTNVSAIQFQDHSADRQSEENVNAGNVRPQPIDDEKVLIGLEVRSITIEDTCGANPTRINN